MVVCSSKLQEMFETISSQNKNSFVNFHTVFNVVIGSIKFIRTSISLIKYVKKISKCKNRSLFIMSCFVVLGTGILAMVGALVPTICKLVRFNQKIKIGALIRKHRIEFHASKCMLNKRPNRNLQTRHVKEKNPRIVLQHLFNEKSEFDCGLLLSPRRRSEVLGVNSACFIENCSSEYDKCALFDIECH